MSITIEYEGEVIEFSEFTEKWRWRDESYAVPSKAKAAIDRSQRIDFKRVECYLMNFQNQPERVTVTSLELPNEAWVVRSNGRRTKEMIKYLIACTPANEEVFKNIAEKKDAIAVIQDEISEMWKLVTMFSPKGKKS